MEKLRVVFVPVGKAAEIKDIDHALEALQRTIGGYIEAVRIGVGDNEDYIIALVDEEGKLKGLAPNLCWGRDTLVGDVIFTKSNNDGDFVSLDDEDVKQIMDWVELSRLALGDS